MLNTHINEKDKNFLNFGKKFKEYILIFSHFSKILIFILFPR